MAKGPNNGDTRVGAARKFMFDLDFDDFDAENDAPSPKSAKEEPEIEPEVEVVVPTFSEEELAVARQEGFEEGRREALKEAAEAVEREILNGLEHISADLERIFAAQADASREIARDAIGIATAIARKMFPDLNARNALGEVERVVVETLKAISEEPRVQILVHPDLREPFNERLKALMHRAGFEGKIFVNVDHSLGIGDCRVEWSNGAAVRDTKETWALIDEIVERNLHGPGGRPEGEAVAEPETVSTATAAESAPASASTAAAPTEPPAPPAAGAAPEASTPSAAQPDEPPEGRTFTPSVTNHDEGENTPMDQSDMKSGENPPAPTDELLTDTAGSDAGDGYAEPGNRPPLDMGDPVSPDMAGAILDAQEDEDDAAPGR